jgi:hypothetical protein
MPKAKFKHGDKEVVTLNAEQWDIIAVRPSDITVYRRGKEPEERDGTCMVPPCPRSVLSRKDRKIKFRNTLDCADLLETLIHEALHALQPDKKEHWVAASAKDVAKVLLKYGFVRNGHDEDGE